MHHASIHHFYNPFPIPLILCTHMIILDYTSNVKFCSQLEAASWKLGEKNQNVSVWDDSHNIIVDKDPLKPTVIFTNHRPTESLLDVAT